MVGNWWCDFREAHVLCDGKAYSPLLLASFCFLLGAESKSTSDFDVACSCSRPSALHADQPLFTGTRGSVQQVWTAVYIVEA